MGKYEVTWGPKHRSDPLTEMGPEGSLVEDLYKAPMSPS